MEIHKARILYMYIVNSYQHNNRSSRIIFLTKLNQCCFNVNEKVKLLVS